MLKEGGKRGVEIEGAADMGGLQSGKPREMVGQEAVGLKIYSPGCLRASSPLKSYLDPKGKESSNHHFSGVYKVIHFLKGRLLRSVGMIC